MKSRSIYRALIVLLIAILIFSVVTTAFALQDDFFKTQSEETQVPEISLFSLMIIIIGSIVVFTIMVTSVVAEIKKRNKK